MCLAADLPTLRTRTQFKRRSLEKKKVADTAENVSNLVLQFLACTHGGSVWALVAEESISMTCHIGIISVCTYSSIQAYMTTYMMIASHSVPMLQGAAGQHATGTGAKLQQPADNRPTEGAQDGSIEMSKAAQRK